jgi:hypothetical protein
MVAVMEPRMILFILYRETRLSRIMIRQYSFGYPVTYLSSLPNPPPPSADSMHIMAQRGEHPSCLRHPSPSRDFFSTSRAPPNLRKPGRVKARGGAPRSSPRPPSPESCGCARTRTRAHARARARTCTHARARARARACTIRNRTRASASARTRNRASARTRTRTCASARTLSRTRARTQRGHSGTHPPTHPPLPCTPRPAGPRHRPSPLHSRPLPPPPSKPTTPTPPSPPTPP